MPISLGDSHRGRPVLGTTPEYFTRFLYGDRQPLVLAGGRTFRGDLDDLYSAVIGAEVAESLGYRSARRSRSATAAARCPGTEHADKPFTIVGVLAPTGTPVDRNGAREPAGDRGDPPSTGAAARRSRA